MQEDTKKATQQVLMMFLLAGGVTLAAANPALIAPAILIAKYMDKNSIDKTRLQRSISYLKRQKYISITSQKDTIKIHLTKKGKRRAALYYFENQLKDRKKQETKSWNGHWYLVVFDIKNEKKSARDALRYSLTKSGFVLFQKSVWIYPFDCTTEIKFIKNFFSITDKECRIILAKDIGDDREFRKKFNI